MLDCVNNGSSLPPVWTHLDLLSADGNNMTSAHTHTHFYKDIANKFAPKPDIELLIWFKFVCKNVYYLFSNIHSTLLFYYFFIL